MPGRAPRSNGPGGHARRREREGHRSSRPTPATGQVPHPAHGGADHLQRPAVLARAKDPLSRPCSTSSTRRDRWRPSRAAPSAQGAGSEAP
eukprot:13859405-Alexandrium_andersonii.AAC.1